MDNPQTVSVIIVTCGMSNYIGSCLDSIKKQTYPRLELIVIDNSRRQDFGEGIIRRYPGIRLFSEPANLFYTVALNKGIGCSRGDFVLCLNDDVVLDSRFIQEGLEGFKRDSSVGMVSGKIMRPDGINIDSTGLFLSLWRSAKERGYGKRDRGQFNRAGYIFGVNGAVAFYRRKMLEDIKIGCDYFDSDFRMFYEDLDLAWRANLLGWKGYYLPGAIAYHVRGGTSRPGRQADKVCARRFLNNQLHKDLIKNRHLSIIKNESLLGFLLFLPFIVFYDCLSLAYCLFFNPKLIKGIGPNFNHLKSALGKRRIIREKYLHRRLSPLRD